MPAEAPVAVNLTPDSLQYVQTLLDLGAVTGSSNVPDPHTGTGTLQVADRIRTLVYALYHVLTGGQAVCSVARPETVTAPNTYTITITPGVKPKFDVLVAMEQTCTNAINDTNSNFSQNYKLVIDF